MRSQNQFWDFNLENKLRYTIVNFFFVNWNRLEFYFNVLAIKVLVHRSCDNFFEVFKNVTCNLRCCCAQSVLLRPRANPVRPSLCKNLMIFLDSWTVSLRLAVTVKRRQLVWCWLNDTDYSIIFIYYNLMSFSKLKGAFSLLLINIS